MAFKEVADLDAEVTTALGGFNKKTKKPNPTKAEGYFLGSKVTKSPKSKNGEAMLHILKTDKGNLGVWGKTDLDRKLRSVAVGTMIRITQNGQVPTVNGDMYKFKVEVDTENTLDISELPSQANTPYSATEDGAEYSAESESEDEEYAEDPEVDADESAEDEVAPPRAAAPKAPAKAPSAERQAKVQALLNKQRSRTA